MNQTFTPEMRRQKMTEKLWLYYFNDVLCEKGLISQEERQRMILRIDEEYDHFLHKPELPLLYSGVFCATVLK